MDLALRRLAAVSVTACLFTPTVSAEVPWPQWGGPTRDFRAVAERPLGAWPGRGPLVLWERPLGPGYSGVLVDEHLLFTMTRRGGDEIVVALSRGTGETVWEYAYAAPVVPDPSLGTAYGEGPNSTPLLVDGRLCGLGFTGIVTCVAARDGAPIWRHDLAAEYEIQSPHFGISASPLHYDGMLIVFADGAFAFDIEDGHLIWENREFDASYASPAIFRFQDRVQIVSPVAGEVIGLDPRTGQLLWRHAHENAHRTFLSSALQGDDGVIFASAYFLGSVGLQLAADGRSVAALWTSPRLQLSHANSVRVGDLVVGFHNSILTALELETGEVVWRQRGFERANLVRLGERLLLLDRNGKLSLVEIVDGGVEPLAEAQILTGRSWTAPSLAGTHLYARNQEKIVAVDLARGEPAGRRRVGLPERQVVVGSAEFLAARERLHDAYLRADAGELGRAAKSFAKWHADDALGHLAHYYAGFALYQQALVVGEPSQSASLLHAAEGHLKRSIEIDPGFAEPHALLGRLYPLYWRFDRARAAVVAPLGVEHMEVARRVDPENPRVAALAAVGLFYRPSEYGGDKDLALARLEELLERFETLGPAAAVDARPTWGHASAWYWYGVALVEHRADYETGIAAFERALTLAPEFVAARRARDEARADRGGPETE